MPREFPSGLWKIAVDGRTDRTCEYFYGDRALVQVNSPVGVFRRYEYVTGGLARVFDGRDRTIEEETKDGGPGQVFKVQGAWVENMSSNSGRSDFTEIRPTADREVQSAPDACSPRTAEKVVNAESSWPASSCLHRLALLRGATVL